MKWRSLMMVLVASVATMAGAQSLSGRPIRMVVPWTAGGGADISARIIAPKLGEALDTQIVIDNKPGATGMLGTDLVAKAAPDGHTLVLGTNSTFVIAAGLFTKMPYDPVKDLTPITRVAAVPHVLSVHPSVPAHTVAELIAYAKANPGKLSFGSSGTGSTPHLAGERFMIATGTNLLHVPYKGSGQSLADTLAGNVQVTFDTLPSVIGHIKGGKLRPLAVLGPTRASSLPGVPAIAEAGVQGAEGVTWYGIYGPAGMDPKVVAQVHREVVKVMASPEIAAKFKEFGAEEFASRSPDEFSKMVVNEIGVYQKVIKQAGIKAP